MKRVQGRNNHGVRPHKCCELEVALILTCAFVATKGGRAKANTKKRENTVDSMASNTRSKRVSTTTTTRSKAKTAAPTKRKVSVRDRLRPLFSRCLIANISVLLSSGSVVGQSLGRSFAHLGPNLDRDI